MNLENILKKGKNLVKNTFYAGLIYLLLTCSPTPLPEPTNPPNTPTPISSPIPTPFPTSAPSTYDYTTTTKIVASKNIDTNGGSLEVTGPNSFLQGSKLTIPREALDSDKFISVAEVNNPPALPDGLGYVGSAMDLEPDGTNFNLSSTVIIPYDDEFLSDAGISSDSNLELYYYNKSFDNWTKVNTFSLDTINNKITAEINHFSYYAITCLNGNLPEDLGTPKPGDLLYTLGAFWNEGNPLFFDNWMPGHAGIYTGEKKYSGTGLASNDVKEFEIYNVIEALWNGVQYSYYDIPNVTETFENSLNLFNGSNLYMGAREPKDCTLTPQQRLDIVAYAEAQIGKPYAWAQTIGSAFGMLRGSLVKGPDKFNCVGLTEKSYEMAGVNNGDGLTTWWQEEVGAFGLPAALTPAEQYNATKPAEYIFNIEDRGPAGGWIFYDKGSYSDGWRYFEAAPADQTSRVWGTYNFTVPGANGTAIGTGEQNTLDIITGDPLPNKAANECANYSIVNDSVTYDDWFLPSKDELDVMYDNLKALGVGGFAGSGYWSSSEDNGGGFAWVQNFYDGDQYYGNKNGNGRLVRAVRVF